VIHLSAAGRRVNEDELMNPLALDDACVYTIKAPERLLEASADEVPLFEAKRWVTARTLLADAQERDVSLPIIFANARDCSRLIAWSVLRSIVVGEKGTHYRIAGLWDVPESRPQDLRRRGTANFIAEGHIRPYVLCETPDFLRTEAHAPRPWRHEPSVRKQALEGRRRLSTHLRLERNRGLVRAFKTDRMQKQSGRLPCEVCGFDFLEVYGALGEGFAEAHHKRSLAESPVNGQVTSLDDLAIVCANCHRMLHLGPEFPDMDLLRIKARRSRHRPE
jgi:hypothetical protein